MLSIDRKKTDKVDLYKPLQQFIRNQYSAQAASDYEESLNNVQQLREDVRNIQDKNEVTKDLMIRYYGVLLSLEVHFPISENNIRISFPWYDSLKQKKTAQYTMHYEKVNVLFNIGAALSQLGGIQNRSSADGLKLACQYYQSAAGFFQEVKNEIEKHPQPNVLDLIPDFVSMCINLMLAQAQECFYEKAVKDNMNPAIVSKLAAQVADYYESTSQMMGLPSISSNIPKAWLSHVQLKALMYKAFASYRVAFVHGTNDEYGLQVARLRSAFTLLEDGKKRLLKSVALDLQQIFNTIHAQITQAFATAEKENDTIYHDTVPSDDKLPTIERKVIVKPVFPDNIRLVGDKDPFAKLIPFAVTEKLSIYQERKDTIVRNELRAIDESNQFAIGSLSSMNLPGAIEALETTPGIPKALQDKVVAVRSEGGARLILEQIEMVAKLAEEDSRVLEQATKRLDDEEREDNDMRQHYGVRWQRTPSHTLTSNLRQEAAKFKGNIDHAKKSDGFVLKKFQEHQQFIVKLSGTADDIAALMPTNKDSALGNSPVVAALKQTLSQLDRLIAERSSLRNQLMQLSQNDDISFKLLGASQGDEEIFAQELAKYQPIQTKLQASFTEQEKLLSKLQQENANFLASRQSNNPNAQREQVLQQLNTAFKVYNELKSNLKEGIQFYTNFQDILKQFSRKCEDFTFARQTEKQDLLNEIQSQSTGVSVPSSASAPPSYAMPPQAAPSPYPAPGYTQPSAPSYQQPPPSWNPNMPPVYARPPQQGPPPSFQPPYAPQQPHIQHPYPGSPHPPPFAPQQPHGYQQPPPPGNYQYPFPPPSNPQQPPYYK